MTENLLSQFETLPECEGIFCLSDQQKKPLYIGVAQNIKEEAGKILFDENSFLNKLKITRIEFVKSSNIDLINLLAKTVRRKKPLFNISLAEQKLYPHLKITGEKFPRLLVTRTIVNDKAEYFGAFLSETGVRFLLDFLNRTFRLRSCTIAIDGKFPLPCTQFYEKKCVAPCVENICNKTDYDEIVELVRLFLRNERGKLKEFLHLKIENAAETLDFETATYWRDILLNVRNVWDNKDLQFWLDDTVDSFEIEEKKEKIYIYLVTRRGRKVLGKRIFVFEKYKEFAPEIILSRMLWQFYQFHAPKEIRVNLDFPNRRFLADVMSRRENRKIKINVVKSVDKKKITEKAFGRTKFEFDLRQIKPFFSYRDVQFELKKEFNLNYLPKRIECFDVAHISGTNFVAAKAVWENGKFSVGEYEYWFLDEKNELKMLEKGIEKSFEANNRLPDLVLIDGGKPQLNAALKAIEKMVVRKFIVIAAVKPPLKHNEVSQFIHENGKTFDMKPESEAMQTLVRLRDEAHDFANRIHRIQRDSSHFYELANLLPFLSESERNLLLQKFGSVKKLKQTAQKDLIELLGFENGEKIFTELNMRGTKAADVKAFIVPIRFDDPNGEAKDLQPLRLTHKN